MSDRDDFAPGQVFQISTKKLHESGFLDAALDILDYRLPSIEISENALLSFTGPQMVALGLAKKI